MNYSLITKNVGQFIQYVSSKYILLFYRQFTLKTTNVNFMVAIKEMSDHQSQDLSCGDNDCCSFEQM